MDIETHFAENQQLASALISAMDKHSLPFARSDIPEDSPAYGKFGPLFYSKQALLSQDTDGILNFYNIGAGDVFGYTPHEAIGMNSILLVPPRFRGGRGDMFRQILEEGIVIRKQTPRLTKDGSLIEINATVFPYELGSNLSIAALVKIV